MGLNLDLTESQEMLKKMALDLMKRDAPRAVVQKLQETETGYSEDLWRKAAELGWLGIIIPEKYGGTGDSLTSAGVLFEALGTGPLPGPYFSSAILGASIVMEAASEAQKQRLLPAVAKGEEILTLALTEADYTWEPRGVQTSATREGGSYVLNGVKPFTMDAGAATHLIVAARTRKGADPAKGISLFLVDRKAPGVSLRQLPGFLIGRTFEVKLNSVKVPRSAMLGEAGGGWPLLARAFHKAAPVLCAYKVGGCQALVDMALEYSRTRVQFGMPIGRFQRVQDMIIEMVDHLDGARWTTYEALWKLDTGRPADESVHLAKAVASEAYKEMTTLTHRVFSGVSYSKEHPASFHIRASHSLYGYLGEPAYHRLQLAKILTAA